MSATCLKREAAKTERIRGDRWGVWFPGCARLSEYKKGSQSTMWPKSSTLSSKRERTMSPGRILPSIECYDLSQRVLDKKRSGGSNYSTYHNLQLLAKARSACCGGNLACFCYQIAVNLHPSKIVWSSFELIQSWSRVHRCRNISVVGLWAGNMDPETCLSMLEAVRTKSGISNLRVRGCCCCVRIPARYSTSQISL